MRLATIKLNGAEIAGIVTKKGNVHHIAENGHLVDVAEVGKVFYVLLVNRDERDVSE